MERSGGPDDGGQRQQQGDGYAAPAPAYVVPCRGSESDATELSAADHPSAIIKTSFLLSDRRPCTSFAPILRRLLYDRFYGRRRRAAHTSKISLAEYFFWAERQRAREKRDTTVTSQPLADVGRAIKGKITKSEKSSDDGSDHKVSAEVQDADGVPDEPSGDLVGLSPYEVELCDARRALRVAGWATSEF